MKREKLANYIISVVGVLVGCVYLYISRNYTRATVDGGFTSAATWPTMLSWAMIGLSVLLFIHTVVRKDLPTSEVRVDSREFRAVLLMMLGLIAYYLSFRYLGCLITNAVFLPVLLICFGERRWWFIVLYDVGALIIIYYLFQVVLRSRLAPPFFL